MTTTPTPKPTPEITMADRLATAAVMCAHWNTPAGLAKEHRDEKGGE